MCHKGGFRIFCCPQEWPWYLSPKQCNLSGQAIHTPTFRRFARIDSQEKPILNHLARFAQIASKTLLSDSHSNSRDSRPILAAIHFLEGRFAKKGSFRSENQFAENIRDSTRIANRFVRIGPLRMQQSWERWYFYKIASKDARVWHPENNGHCPKILLPKTCSVPSIGVIGKSALEIGQFLRRNFWMISGGPFLSQPLVLLLIKKRTQGILVVSVSRKCPERFGGKSGDIRDVPTWFVSSFT